MDGVVSMLKHLLVMVKTPKEKKGETWKSGQLKRAYRFAFVVYIDVIVSLKQANEFYNSHNKFWNLCGMYKAFKNSIQLN